MMVKLTISLAIGCLFVSVNSDAAQSAFNKNIPAGPHEELARWSREIGQLSDQRDTDHRLVVGSMLVAGISLTVLTAVLYNLSKKQQRTQEQLQALKQSLLEGRLINQVLTEKPEEDEVVDREEELDDDGDDDFGAF